MRRKLGGGAASSRERSEEKAVRKRKVFSENYINTLCFLLIVLISRSKEKLDELFMYLFHLKLKLKMANNQIGSR